MLKALVLIAVVIVAAVGVVLALAMTKPDQFHVERRAAIQAPPERIVGLIDDLQAWAAWSPYEKKDPAMQRTFSGAGRGKGAIYQWSGNGNVGSGRMEIVETSPSKVVIKLDMFTPFEGHNVAEFTLVPNGAATDVPWAMHGPAPLLTKVMQVFLNMDRLIGDDFAAGLANLKTVAEK